MSIKIDLVAPEVDVKDEYYTGIPQEVKKIEIELLRPIIAKYSEDKVTEFQTLMPVKITIKR